MREFKLSETLRALFSHISRSVHCDISAASGISTAVVDVALVVVVVATVVVACGLQEI